MTNEKTTDREKGRRAIRVAGCLRRLGFSHRGVSRECTQQGWREILREEGANLVEMALASTVLFAMLFGIIEFSMAIYTYTFVNEAAREATRYAVVRGSDSCLPSPSPAFPNCNLNPAGATNETSTNPLQTYVQGLGYPFAQSMTVTSNWYQKNGTTQPVTWTTLCTAADQTAGSTCNADGNEVQVTVSYAFPLHIPFWTSGSFPVTSTSEMVINF